MDEEDRIAIDSWACLEAQKDQRIERLEVNRLNPYARDRYAFERGAYEHALQPSWGIAAPMIDIVSYMNADHEVIANFIRTELDDGEKAAKTFLDAL